MNNTIPEEVITKSLEFINKSTNEITPDDKCIKVGIYHKNKLFGVTYIVKFIRDENLQWIYNEHTSNIPTYPLELLGASPKIHKCE